MNMSVWKYVCERRLEKQMNVTVQQMYIDEDPRNRLLNKSITILIWILSVSLVFPYFYFGN